MYPYPCTYHRPQSLDAVLALIKDLPDGKFLAGGQTLIQAMKLRLAAPSDLIDLQGIAQLSGIREQEGALHVGAMTRHSEVAASILVRQHNPALAHLASCIGDRQVRNQGTMGGSVANNDPAADYPAAILALNATIHTDRRQISAQDFFTGMYATDLEEGELITSLSLPTPQRAAYVKFFSPASGFALVGVFVAQFASCVRVAITGAASCVFRATAFEQELSKSFSPAAIASLTLDADEYDFSTDMHASRAYRARLCTVLTRRAVEQALQPASA